VRDERSFLQALLADPTDDGLRQVYADWLEEQNEPASAFKAEFLRLTAELAISPGTERRQEARRQRLQQLAADLNTDWLAVVSRLPVENCQGKRREAEPLSRGYQIRFDYLCDRRWEDLRTTEDQAVRYCGGCRQDVHYCDTIMQARRHAQNGHCIAVDLGVIRRQDDLEPQRLWMGWPSPETVRQEEERMRPDAVSAERERRKRGQPPRPGGRAARRRAARARRRAPAPPWPVHEVGARVQVLDGTFAGMEGVVREVLEARGAVRIELTIFGRTVPVELESWQLERASE
jgi:uncharacterized protein (TIGR02996 family)